MKFIKNIFKSLTPFEVTLYTEMDTDNYYVEIEIEDCLFHKSCITLNLFHKKSRCLDRLNNKSIFYYSINLPYWPDVKDWNEVKTQIMKIASEKLTEFENQLNPKINKL